MEQSNCCTHCPFALTNESEYVQGLGCLPSPYDIKTMKEKSGHNWACHSNENVLCRGFSEFVRDVNSYSHLDLSIGGLIKYSIWYHEGEEAAIKEADK